MPYARKEFGIANQHTFSSWIRTFIHQYRYVQHLTVGLLVARSSAVTTELLGLASAGVRHQEGAVVGDQGVLELALGGLVNVCGTKHG